MIFKKKTTWHKVFPSLEAAERRVPAGQSLTVEAGTRKVCMARTEDGLFALGSKCPHQGQPLGGGKCEEGRIICPYHQYRFDLKTGKGHGMYVEVYPVEVRDDGVYVGVERTVFNLF